MATEEELRAGLDIALDDLDGDTRQRIAGALIDLAFRDDRSRESLRAIDGTLRRGSGGYAFRWEDVFGLSEAARSSKPLLEDLSPSDAALVLLYMLRFWQRIRSVRVELSRDEFQILRAVKRGTTSYTSIAAQTAIDAERVRQVVDELRQRRYRGDTPLIDGDDGGFVTSF